MTVDEMVPVSEAAGRERMSAERIRRLVQTARVRGRRDALGHYWVDPDALAEWAARQRIREGASA